MRLWLRLLRTVPLALRAKVQEMASITVTVMADVTVDVAVVVAVGADALGTAIAVQERVPHLAPKVPLQREQALQLETARQVAAKGAAVAVVAAVRLPQRPKPPLGS